MRVVWWPNNTRLAIGACALALTLSSGVAASNAHERSSTPHSAPAGQHIELLDDFETLWADRREPDESEVELYVRAVSGSETTALDKCAYTVWNVVEGQDWLEARFDPAKEPQWQLVSVGGAAPLEEQLSKFETRRLPPISTARAMEDGETIPPGVLAVLHRTEDHIFFGAMPHTLEDVPRQVRKMRPLIVLVVSRQNARLHIVDFRSTRRTSLGFGIRLSSLHHRHIYEYDEAVGAMVAKYRETKMRGRAYLIARLVIDESQWYGDISCDADST